MDSSIYEALKGRPIEQWTNEELQVVLADMKEREPDTYRAVREVAQSISVSSDSVSPRSVSVRST